MSDLDGLRRDAREIFARGLDAVDARRAVLEAVRVEGARLSVCDTVFDIGETGRPIYSIALGKAGAAMASALDERLRARLAGGVVSAPANGLSLSGGWRIYAGGHPLPNEESFAAARAAFDLLRRADEEAALVIFMVSGGGSAMMELPRDARVTLEELREANRTLVSCGAGISEINAIRRALSRVKGGGLSRAASRAAQVTLIVSDTNAGRERDVASGPTLEPDDDTPDPREVIARHDLSTRLPSSVLRAVEESEDERGTKRLGRVSETRRMHFVLLDNATACEAAARAARRLGYATAIAHDLVEQHVEQGAALSVSRLLKDEHHVESEGGVCLISGGEFACPVRGGGTGGRNSETALRCAFEFAARMKERRDAGLNLAALSAGTDGIDGNSPAAGALADQMTLARAAAHGLSPERHLDDSDAFTFFDALGDTIITGPTGTNVRDLRVIIARKRGGH